MPPAYRQAWTAWRYRLSDRDSDLYVIGEPCTLDEILRYLRLKYGIERIIYAAPCLPAGRPHCKAEPPSIESAFPKSTE